MEPLSGAYSIWSFSDLARLSCSHSTTTTFLFENKMSTDELYTDLKAPNGREYKQPLGLFINNEFVKSSSGEKITSINPTCDLNSSKRSYLL